jgi:all-trans-retinol 13,14-reductase
MKYDVVIIGSGLGGLLCGNILSREGLSVCLIEKNHKLGGSLQDFGRKGCIFNTGLNYTESLDKGQVLHQYFKYLGLTDKLKLKRLNADGFDIIHFGDQAYKLAIGHDNFRDSLLEHFPEEKEGLNRYLEKIRETCHSIPLYTFKPENANYFDMASLNTGAADFIRSVIKNFRLQQVIAGNNFLYAGHENKTPLFIHALISNSFIESAWRLMDGSHQLVNALAENIVRNGGRIYKNARAVKFLSGNNVIRQVELENGEPIEGGRFISNTHPAQLVKMMDSNKILSFFSRRINSLEDTIGMFTLYLVFKKNSFPYLNYNHYQYNQENVWVASSYNSDNWPQQYVFMCTATSKSDVYAESASVISYMHFNEVKKWVDTYTGNRGEEYENFKKLKAEKLINSLEIRFSGIKSCIEGYYTSTPLTWRDYTGTQAGSAYGILKDFNRPLETLILPRTRISNLLLTGQNINVHGILGVTISSVLTCAEIIDVRYLLSKIKSA